MVNNMLDLMFAKSLVLIEGVDGTGKSTIIKQLQDKYGPSKIKTMAFPVNREILKVEYDKADDQAIKGYHKMFLKDFIDNQRQIGKLCGEVDNNPEIPNDQGVVLLDRYFPSFLAYCMLDIMNHMSTVLNYDTNKILKDLIDIQNTSLKIMLNRLILPVHIIYLYSNKYDHDRTDSKTRALQALYEMVLTALKKPSTKFQQQHHPIITEIEGLQKDTFEKVESVLKKAGYL
jgi:hypothetical protein